MLRHYLFFCGVLIASGSARPDEPTASYIFPAGGQRGTTVKFRAGGHYFHDHCVFHMEGDGLAAVDQLQRCEQTVWFEGPVIPLPDSQQKEDYPVDYLGSVQIASDAAADTGRWRISTSQGVTTSLPFVIGDLPEIVEQEIDGRPVPRLIQLPVTINGRVFPREDIDIWSFDARAGETITCEVHAARIGSPLDSRLKVIGPNGNTLSLNDDAAGKDSRVSFKAAHDGRHHVHLWDADLGGLQHYVYRLTITSGPHTEAVYPLGGRRGTTAAIEQIGIGLQQTTQEVVIPSDAGKRIPFPHTRDIWLEPSDLEELLEQEPNDTPETATAAGSGTVLNGRIQTPGDLDIWRLEMRKETPLDLDLRAARLNSPLDSVLTIHDADGRPVAESDDMAKGQTDSQLRFNPPADGIYTITVSDRFAGRGDPRFGYRLHVRPASSVPPSFALKLPSDALNLNRGSEATLKVLAERQHGFTGSIQCTIDGLPEGVSVDEATIASGKNETTLKLKATEEAPVAVVRLSVKGRGEADGMMIEQTAGVPATVPGEEPNKDLWLGVTVPTPFKLVGDFETKYAARGSTYVRHFRIERGDYTGPLSVRLAERQTRHLQGVTGPIIEVPAGVSEFDFPVFLPPWMEIGRTSRTCLMAVGRVVLNDGSQHTVSYTSFEQNDQIIVLVDPGQMSVRLERSSLLARAGMTAEIPVTVQRGPAITGPVRIELVAAAHMKGITCEPQEVPADSDRAILRVEFSSEQPGPFNMPVIVRATAGPTDRPWRAEAPLTLIAVPALSAR